MAYVPGVLVKARGREWVVLPQEEAGVTRLRPVDGFDEDATGIADAIEPRSITTAEYAKPDPATAGGITAAELLRDAARLTLRSGAGPFRSLGRLSVRPRPYQFVPLLMALRQETTRLLIADDVGVGKTVEAGMIARELLDRGVIKRIGVLCPPHLCDQWATELREKFGIEAAVVQPSRISKLERDLPRRDLSIYRGYAHLVASIDYVKSDRQREAFVGDAPEFIIVDEAHASARPGTVEDAGQHQRFDLLRQLAARTDRHIVLVTATPHSGVSASFRSLVGLLDPTFDPPGADDEIDRRALLPYVVQRRRPDLAEWLGDDAPFPDRVATERAYSMTDRYRSLFDDMLAYCRETVTMPGLQKRDQRVRYWAALTNLRCLLSSPEAAAAMLDKRAAKEIDTADDLDAVFAPQLFETDEDAADYAPATPADDSKLRRLLARARALNGPEHDTKIAACAQEVGNLLAEGFRPIVYCRFIDTALYVRDQLEKLLKKRHAGLVVDAVTGLVGDDQRREKVAAIADAETRVLVATDCLSEGINLQHAFDAVVHYDLPWNPNRLEQREGRVDRFGQARPVVRTVLLHGSDNPVDQIVLDVLIRKAKTIRSQLGIAVPLPEGASEVVEALVDSVLLAPKRPAGVQLAMGFEDAKVSRFQAEWDQATDRERALRTFFAQHRIQPTEVAAELDELEPALGTPDDVRRFLGDALPRFGGELRTTRRPGVFDLFAGDLKEPLQRRIGPFSEPIRVAFDLPKDAGTVPTILGRTHPIVAITADAVLGRALGAALSPGFTRCGAVLTGAVDRRTVVLILRLRYQLKEGGAALFAEEIVVPAFVTRGGAIEWIGSGVDLLAQAGDDGRDLPERRERIAAALGLLTGEWYVEPRKSREVALQEAHFRVRQQVGGGRVEVGAHLPPDVLGCYVLEPR